jgi:predicted transcriptional regulator
MTKYLLDSPEQKALASITSVAFALRRDKKRLDEGIREAATLGISLRELAEATDLSHETVRRILKTPAH